jgi:hypothetical protein
VAPVDDAFGGRYDAVDLHTERIDADFCQLRADGTNRLQPGILFHAFFARGMLEQWSGDDRSPKP